MSAGQTVVVSGAGTGIGRAVTSRLIADGFHVTAVGRRKEPLDELTAALGSGVDVVAADVATELGALSVASKVEAAGVACAGVVTAAGGLVPDVQDPDRLTAIRQDWQNSFESNVLTAVLLTEALRPVLERDGGRVVLISSVAALRGSGGGPNGAMKAARP
ncbi:MAG TPA: SDR family oxidoreductase, partial [Streptosporangiaceae bacterium]